MRYKAILADLARKRYPLSIMLIVIGVAVIPFPYLFIHFWTGVHQLQVVAVWHKQRDCDRQRDHWVRLTGGGHSRHLDAHRGL